MKQIVDYFCKYSKEILLNIFYAYFLFLVGLYCLDIEITAIYGFIYFFILGLYLGNLIALKVSEYQRKKE
ncbi:hypothetical protein BSYN_18720 [Bacteroides sedimenti]|uniref:Uncharacterized protein n=1 Tax=Bacteroides sedimenti TaxID=2136147 RepID=A0ABN6Z4W8_9BACE